MLAASLSLNLWGRVSWEAGWRGESQQDAAELTESCAALVPRIPEVPAGRNELDQRKTELKNGWSHLRPPCWAENAKGCNVQ